MQVVHLVPALFGADGGLLGGAERYVLELARHMSERVPTRLVSFGDRAREERIGNLEIRVIGSPYLVRGQRNNPLAFSILGEIRGADVVHCHQQHILASSLSALAARMLGRKVFVTDLGGGGWDISAYVSTDGWYHGHLHISEYSRRIYGHEDYENAYVVSGGVDVDRFSPDPGVTRGDTALYVGRLLPHKGVDYLVEAAGNGVGVELIGQPYDPAYMYVLSKLAQGREVQMRHECDDVELIRAYRQALCIVLPSVHTSRNGHRTKVPELLGQTLLEGMACGTPAICTNVASMPEVVVDGETGFMVPPNDPAALRERILWMQNHPLDVERMGKAARERVLTRFTWPRVVDRCLAIYRGEGLTSAAAPSPEFGRATA